MNASVERFGPLLGRVLIALLFIPAGLGKIGDFQGAAGYIASAGLPLPAVLAVIAILIEVGVAGALLIGWQARWAALILALFTLVAETFVAIHPSRFPALLNSQAIGGAPRGLTVRLTVVSRTSEPLMPLRVTV